MLYEHQISGAQWLAQRSRAYLGDRPGLGKTRTLLAALDESDNPLVVCPAIVRTHWAREAALLNVENITIRSYDAIVRGGKELMAKLIRDEKINTLITDEHHYLKHAGSQRTKLLLGRNGYAPRLPRVYAASGTPVPKHPAELWTTLASLFPQVAAEHGLKTQADFIARFCVTRGRFVRGKWIEKILPDVRNEAEFREILSKIMLARTLDDVGLDVPALDWQTTRLDGASTVGDPVFADGYAAAPITRALDAGVSLAEIALDPHVARIRRRLGELKAPSAAAKIASELGDSGEKVVVFAHHRSVLAELRERLAPFGVAYVDGDVNDARRNVEIDRFQVAPGCRVFLGQNIACQTGITLTAARRAFLVEPDWTAVVNDQLGHRVARIGQKAERCIAHMIALADTLDEAIIAQNIREVRMAATLGLGD